MQRRINSIFQIVLFIGIIGLLSASVQADTEFFDTLFSSTLSFAQNLITGNAVAGYDGTCSSPADIEALPAGTWCAVADSLLVDAQKMPEEYDDFDGVSSRAFSSIQRNLQLKNGIFAWSGGAFDSTRDRLMVFGGGHNAYGGNEVYAFDLPSLSWIRITDPTPFSLRGGLTTYVHSIANTSSEHRLGGQINFVPGITLSEPTVFLEGSTPVNLTRVDFDTGFDGWVYTNFLNLEGAVPGAIKPNHISAGTRIRMDDGIMINNGNYDDTPISRHSYSGLTYVESTDEFFVFGGSPDNPYGGCGQAQAWLLSLSGIDADGYQPSDWRRANTTGEIRSTCNGWAQYVPDHDAVYVRMYVPGQHFRYYNISTDSWHYLNAAGSFSYSDSVYDPVNKLLLDLGQRYGNTYGQSEFNVSTVVPTQRGIPLRGDYARVAGQPGLAFHPPTGYILQWRTGTDLVLYNPISEVHSLLPADAENLVDPGTTLANGAVYGRFAYSPTYDVVVTVNDPEEPVYLYKVGDRPLQNFNPAVQQIDVSAYDDDPRGAPLQQVAHGKEVVYRSSGYDFEGGIQEVRWEYTIDGGSRQVHSQEAVSGANVTSEVAYTYSAQDVGSTYTWYFVLSDGLVTSESSFVHEVINMAPKASKVFVRSASSTTVEFSATDANNDALTYSIVTPPSNGVLSGSGAARTYTPNVGFSGEDSFVYAVSDGSLSDTATVYITVEPEPAVPVWNVQPVGGQFHTLEVGVPVSINLRDLVDAADDFVITLTSRSEGEPLLPDGLSLVNGVIQGTPTQAGAFALRVRAVNGERDAEVSWARRSSASINSENFANEQVVRLSSDRLTGVEEYSQWDDQVKVSGNGALRQVLPAAVTDKTANWVMPTVPVSDWNEQGGFYPGETFFVQYQYRPDKNMVQYDGWLSTTPKISIIDMLPGFPGGATANAWEIVTIMNMGHLYGYYNGPNGAGSSAWEIGKTTRCQGRYDFHRTPEVDNGADQLNGVDPGLFIKSGNDIVAQAPDSPWRGCQQDLYRYGHLYGYRVVKESGIPYPTSGGSVFHYDQWHTILQEIVVGKPGYTNTELRTWYAPEGQDYVLLMNKSFAPRSWESTQETVFEGLWLLNLAYQAAANPNKPETTTWYDEVIISDEFIPAPDVGDATGSYRTSDTIITLRVNTEPQQNVAPTSSPASYTIQAAQELTLTGNDLNGDSLTYRIVQQPSNGILSSVVGNRVTYTPTSGFTGNDFFTYAVDDGQFESAPATVSVVVEEILVPFSGPFNVTPFTYSFNPSSVGAVTGIVLYDEGAGSGRPVSFGLPFGEGAFTSGSDFVVTDSSGAVLPSQFNELAAWRTDASLLHGMVSFTTPLSGDNDGVYYVVPSSVAGSSSLSGVAVSKSAIVSAGFDAVVSVDIAGVVYSLSAADLLSGSVVPRQDYVHFSGPLSSEFIVGGPLLVDGSGSAHAFLQAYFHVRAFDTTLDGVVDDVKVNLVLESTGVWTELSNIADADVLFTVAGTERYASVAQLLKADTRLPKEFWWKENPLLWVQHDVEYVQDTKLVPEYQEVNLSESMLAAFPREIDYLGRGQLSSAMSSGGAQAQIAPLDRWSAAYLISGDKRAYDSMLAHDDAYHWASYVYSVAVNLRDEETGFPLDLNRNAATRSTIANTWGGPNAIAASRESTDFLSFDTSHAPQPGLVPYLLTGDFHRLEQAQNWAIYPWHMIGTLGWPKNIAFKNLQVRGHAWGLRNMVAGAIITPDAHPLKTTLTDAVTYALNDYANFSVAVNAYGAGLNNDFGVFNNGDQNSATTLYSSGSTPNPDDTGTLTGFSSWMDDYLTYAVGSAYERGWKTELDVNGLWEWKSRFAIGRLGDLPGFCWEYAALSAVGLRDDASSPFYSSLSEVFSKNFPDVVSCAPAGAPFAFAWMNSGILKNGDRIGTAYGAQLGGAITIATDTDMPGAAAAWDRYSNRDISTWDSGFDIAPEWAVDIRNEPDAVPTPELTPDADWLSRISNPGVFYYNNFNFTDFAALVDTVYYGDNDRNPERMFLTEELALSASKALKFTIRPQDGEGVPSYFHSFAMPPKNRQLSEIKPALYYQFAFYLPEETMAHRFKNAPGGTKLMILYNPYDPPFAPGEIVITIPAHTNFLGGFKVNGNGANNLGAWYSHGIATNGCRASAYGYQTAVDYGPIFRDGESDTTNCDLFKERHGALGRLGPYTNTYGAGTTFEQGNPDPLEDIYGASVVPDAWNVVEVYVNLTSQEYKVWHARYGEEPKLIIHAPAGTAELGNDPDIYHGAGLLFRPENTVPDDTRPALSSYFDEIIASDKPIPFPGGHPTPDAFAPVSNAAPSPLVSPISLADVSSRSGVQVLSEIAHTVSASASDTQPLRWEWYHVPTTGPIMEPQIHSSSVRGYAAGSGAVESQERQLAPGLYTYSLRVYNGIGPRTVQRLIVESLPLIASLNPSSPDLYADDNYQVDLNSALTITPIINDDMNTYSWEYLRNGVVVRSGTGVVPALDLTFSTPGMVNVTLRMTRGGNAFSNSVILDVLPVVQAQPVHTATDRDTPLAITFAGRSANAGTLIYEVQAAPIFGTIAGGVYTPNTGFSGVDSFSYIARDGGLASAPATVSIVVGEVSVPMVNFGGTAQEDVFSFSDWTNVFYDVYTGRSDLGPAGITITRASSSQTYSYQGISGSEETFRAGESILVNLYNPRDTPIVVSALISLDDPDRRLSGQTGTWYAMSPVYLPARSSNVTNYTFTQTTAGKYSLVNINPNYPGAGSVLVDAFAYVLQGSSRNFFENAFSGVIPPPPTNNPPSGAAQSVSLAAGSSRVITLGGSDADGDALTYTVTRNPLFGSVSGLFGNEITYTPNTGFDGNDNFSYVVSDGLLESAPATVSVVVEASTAVINATTDVFADSFNSSLAIIIWEDLSLNVSPDLSYRVYRDDVVLGDASDRFFLDRATLPQTTYTYIVEKFDGGERVNSTAFVLTTDTLADDLITVPFYSVISPVPLMTGFMLDTAYPELEYNSRMAIVGGKYPYSFALDVAPPGMSIDARGVVTWTPGVSLVGQSFPVVVRFVDALGQIGMHAYTVTVSVDGFIFTSVNDGSDETGDGSIGNPFASINHSILAGSQNDTVYMRGGEYVGRWAKIESSTATRIIEYPGEEVKVNLTFTRIALAAPYMYFRGMEFYDIGNKLFRHETMADYSTVRDVVAHDLYDKSRAENPAFYFTVGVGNDNYRRGHIVLQDNLFYNLVDRGSGLNGDETADYHGGGWTLFDVEDSLFEDNTVHTIDGHGMFQKDGGNRNTFRNNLFYNVTKYGIGLGNQAYGYNLEVLYNRVYTPEAASLQIGASSGPRANFSIHHNTFVGQMATEFSNTMIPDYESSKIHDNIFISNQPRYGSLFCCGGPTAYFYYFPRRNYLIDNNLYYDPDRPFFAGVPWKQEFTSTFQEWQEVYLNDVHGAFAEPWLVSPETLNFTPYANSPACGAASDGGDVGAVACSSVLPLPPEVQLLAPADGAVLRDFRRPRFAFEVLYSPFPNQACSVFVDDVPARVFASVGSDSVAERLALADDTTHDWYVQCALPNGTVLTSQTRSFELNFTPRFRMDPTVIHLPTSTNFSAISKRDLESLPGVVLNNSFGTVRFRENIAIDRSMNVTDYVRMGPRSIYLDATGLAEFNLRANLSFYAVDLSSPVLYRDNVLCAPLTCANTSFDAAQGIFTAQVVGFSNYSLEEEGAIIVTSPLAVDFGADASADVLNFSDWTSVFSDESTSRVALGPDGFSIVSGTEGLNSYQGINGSALSFAADDIVEIVFYNALATPVTFTPYISFDDSDRRTSGVGGTWYALDELAINATSSGLSRFVFDTSSQGSYSLLNLNPNYDGERAVVVDVIYVNRSGVALSSCGDTVCSVDENVSSCPLDCAESTPDPVLPPETSGSSGGGGGGGGGGGSGGGASFFGALSSSTSDGGSGSGSSSSGSSDDNSEPAPPPSEPLVVEQIAALASGDGAPVVEEALEPSEEVVAQVALARSSTVFDLALWSLLGVLVFGLFTVAGWYVSSHLYFEAVHKEAQALSNFKGSSRVLRAFVLKSLDSGMDHSVIREKLVKVGWHAETVDKELLLIRKEQEEYFKSAMSAPPSAKKKL